MPDSLFSPGASAILPSVESINPAIEAAFWRAVRVSFAVDDTGCDEVFVFLAGSVKAKVAVAFADLAHDKPERLPEPFFLRLRIDLPHAMHFSVAMLMIEKVGF